MADSKHALKEFRQSLKSLCDVARTLGPSGIEQARAIEAALAQPDEQWETAIQIKMLEQREQKSLEVGQSVELPDPRSRTHATRKVVITPILRACADLVV